jgi:lipopolysaccharide/colanic/teichoic acid biosynthesis glycosyltransferase
VSYTGATAGETDTGVLGSRSSARLIRVFDLAVTILVLPFALIAGAAIAVIIFVDSPGPIFYHSRRVGKGGEQFDMLKFRKMRRDATGAPLTKLRDERLTPIGEFLVATKLDELPQLWNVLRGEMRLVGPRPELEEFVTMYAREYQEILSVPPGIAGHTQLQFAQLESVLLDGSNAESYYARELMPRKVGLDLHYVRTRSAIGDLRILGSTLLLPLKAFAGRLESGWSQQTRWARTWLVLTSAAAIALPLLFLVASGPAR